MDWEHSRVEGRIQAQGFVQADIAMNGTRSAQCVVTNTMDIKIKRLRSLQITEDLAYDREHKRACLRYS